MVQRATPTEILIQDDASTDDTVAVALEVAANLESFPRVQVNDSNLGAPENRNRAIARASGEYILMLDADNVLDYDSTLRLAAEAHQMQSDVVAASYSEMRTFRDVFGDSYSWIMTSQWVSLNDAVRDLAMPAVSSGNWIFRRRDWETVGGYPQFARSWDTHLFALRLLSLGNAIVVSDTHYHHRLRDGSNFLVHQDDIRHRAFAQVLRELRDHLDDATAAYALRVHSATDARIFSRGLSASLPKGQRLFYSTKLASPRGFVAAESRRLRDRMLFALWALLGPSAAQFLRDRGNPGQGCVGCTARRRLD